jgi:hypothetical protein
MRPKPITLLAFVLLLCNVASAQAGKINDYLKSEMAKRHISGVSVAIIRDGRADYRVTPEQLSD